MTLPPTRRAAAALLLALGGLTRARAAEGAPVRIGWLRGTNDVTLGKARGTIEAALAGAGARVEWAGPFPAAAPAVEALNAGAIDVTVGSSTSTVTALAAGAPAVIFAYQRLGPDAEAILVPGTSALHSVRDLAGRSVAVNRGGTGEYLLARALEMAGLDPGSVRRVYLGPAEAGPGFAAGHVDAWAIWDPFLTIALRTYGARVLADGAAIGSRNAIVMIAHRDFAAARRPLLRAVYEAIRADNAWSVADRTAAGAIWARELKLPEDYAADLGRRGAVPTGPVGPAQVAEIASVADWSVAQGLAPARPDFAAGTVDLSRDLSR